MTHEERIADLKRTYYHLYENAWRTGALGAQDMDSLIYRLAKAEYQVEELKHLDRGES